MRLRNEHAGASSTSRHGGGICHHSVIGALNFRFVRGSVHIRVSTNLRLSDFWSNLNVGYGEIPLAMTSSSAALRVGLPDFTSGRLRGHFSPARLPLL